MRLLTKVDIQSPNTPTIADQAGPGEIRPALIWLFPQFVLGALSNYISVALISALDHPPQPWHLLFPFPISLTPMQACLLTDHRIDMTMVSSLSPSVISSSFLDVVLLLHYLDDYLAVRAINSRLSFIMSSASCLGILFTVVQVRGLSTVLSFLDIKLDTLLFVTHPP